MTRKKQANAAAVEFLSNQPHGYFKTESERNTAHTGFIMGVRWADEHQLSLWISVNDHLPPIDSDEVSGDVIVKTKDGHWYQAWYDYEMQEWINAGRGACKYIEDVTHWMDPKELK